MLVIFVGECGGCKACGALCRLVGVVEDDAKLLWLPF